MSAILKARGAKASPSLADIGYLSNFAGDADGYILIASLLALGSGVLWADSGGWITGEAWTYISATSFSAVGDLTGKYSKGDRVRLTNSAATKYFYIIGVTFGAGITTFTITGGSDYSLAAGAISAPSYSKEETPVGFPQWFNWTTTRTGFSANPTNVAYRFSLIGAVVTLAIAETTDGTSNATSFTITAPITSANIANMTWFSGARCTDNGVTFSASCFLSLAANSNVITLFKLDSATGWTATGGKKLRNAFLTYEI